LVKYCARQYAAELSANLLGSNHDRISLFNKGQYASSRDPLTTGANRYGNESSYLASLVECCDFNYSQPAHDLILHSRCHVLHEAAPTTGFQARKRGWFL
jgi:hypothetical protein